MDEEKNQQKTDPFTRMMFGDRSNSKQKQKTDSADIDYSTLFQQLNDIMESYEKIKPAIKELSPLIDLFKQNKKG